MYTVHTIKPKGDKDCQDNLETETVIMTTHDPESSTVRRVYRSPLSTLKALWRCSRCTCNAEEGHCCLGAPCPRCRCPAFTHSTCGRSLNTQLAHGIDSIHWLFALLRLSLVEAGIHAETSVVEVRYHPPYRPGIQATIRPTLRFRHRMPWNQKCGLGKTPKK